MPKPLSIARIASIDVLRALTMLLMIFVNDLWTLKDIPAWLEHTEANEDGMGLADTVFPAFLFIVGMSIPFSVGNRRVKGESDGSITWHVVSRSFALLVMGLFLVNGEYLHEANAGISRAAWFSLSCLSFILLWNSWPKTINKWVVRILQLLAIIILLVLIYLCRGGDDGVNRFQPYWWGILGLIGWAYLVSALIFVFAGRYFYMLVIAWLLFMGLSIASHAGWIENDLVKTIIDPLGNGAMPAFTMGGILISMIFLHYKKVNNEITARDSCPPQADRSFIIVLLLISVALFALGYYLRSFWGISKIRATPAWVLVCSAITIVFFVFLYWLVDIKKKGNWFALISPAGTNTLLCYLLPYFIYALVGVLGIGLPVVLLTGVIGLIKSLLFSLLIVVIAGLLGRVGVRVRL